MRFGITIVWAAASAWTVSSTPTQLVAHPSTGRPMPWSSQLSERNAANTAKRPDAIQDALLTRLMSIPELSKYPETLGLVSDVMAFVDEQDDGGDITLAGGPSASKLDPYSKLLLSAKLEVTESTLVMAEAAKEEPESSAPDEKKYTETSKQKEDKKKDLVTKVMLGVKSGSVLFTFADDYDQFVKCFKNLVYLKNKIMTAETAKQRVQVQVSLD
ncbi:hypothetical protein HYQ45_001479 [Verticillium longisporum]|uniref:Uncharacterized protein n=1 Tax=Verticillium longisporum TaxID=100787 RepID=A0A8I3AYK4_VERLO|nr:hypothetical protein HYQ45_001479 [Verticillium longisporum]